ncbi:acyl-CoA-binding protein, putative [Eimeria tenella]|uniref:Acyl-CoA-binding protein, putative n=1 Tax=Eimeria tenella TaxID=5802 RepID=U6L396_EIMTE|nr:acyl-CoA-binding protein, putative [Eimeria tenella]CDJ43668.1 acyl-CoA-binding protein, putative [Eimeria tenella]|eukprot:XP_013234417.1 acyl-CoA-binding protein, putative [Eimeria tenella]
MSSEFEKAVEFVRKPAAGAEPSTAQKLRFYGLYKQATVGDNETPEPSFYQIEAKQKWKAWAELKGMDKATAQAEYVKALDSSSPNWRQQAN